MSVSVGANVDSSIGGSWTSPAPVMSSAGATSPTSSLAPTMLKWNSSAHRSSDIPAQSSGTDSLSQSESESSSTEVTVTSWVQRAKCCSSSVEEPITTPHSRQVKVGASVVEGAFEAMVTPLGLDSQVRYVFVVNLSLNIYRLSKTLS